jgi:hypothetical protein
MNSGVYCASGNLYHVKKKSCTEALRCFNNGDWTNSKLFFEKFMTTGIQFYPDDVIKYFTVLIKLNNPKINIDDTNSYYRRLLSFIDSLSIKIESGQRLSEDEININNLKQYESGQKIKFGKYQNMKVNDILSIDPTYIFWCVVNLIHFAIDPVLLLKIPKVMPDFIESLEYNLIKIDIIQNLNHKLHHRLNDDDTNECNSYQGYGSASEMSYYEAFDGDDAAWDHYNQ